MSSMYLNLADACRSYRSMKTLITFLISTLSLAAFASPSVIATYKCGVESNSTVRVLKDDKTYSIAISYPVADHLVNIMSQPFSIKDANAIFAADESESLTTQALTSLTDLPDDSVAFTGFHYPKSGKSYIVAEGDSNEEGFIFAADQALLNGATTAHAAKLYWSEFHATQVSKFDCTRVH